MKKTLNLIEKLQQDIEALKKGQARIEALLREVLCPPRSVEIKELARQFTGGNRQALKEWNKKHTILE